MATFIQRGDVIDYTAGSAVAAGDVITVGSGVGIAQYDIAAGETGAISITGVYEFPLAAGPVGLGDELYWDASTGVATASATGNTRIGFAVAAVATGGTAVRIKIG